jgi:hypothetical protein
MEAMIEEDWPAESAAAGGLRVETKGSARGPSLWRRAVSQDGRPYWYHTGTRETTWDNPDDEVVVRQGRSPGVRIRHIHQTWADRMGQVLNPERDQDMVMDIQPRDVRKRLAVQPAVTLSALIVRKQAKTEDGEFNEEQWGPVSSSVSDSYVTAVERTFYGALGPDYEVFTAFVERSSDLLNLMPAAVTAAMTGKHKCACYFLWPTVFQDHATDETGCVHAGVV